MKHAKKQIIRDLFRLTIGFSCWQGKLNNYFLVMKKALELVDFEDILLLKHPNLLGRDT